MSFTLAGMAAAPFIKPIIEILKIPVPLVVVVGVMAGGLVYHWADKGSAIRAAIIKAQAVADVQRAKEKKAADAELARNEAESLKKDEALQAAYSEAATNLARALEAEGKDPIIKTETVLVPKPRTVTLACPKVNNAEPKTLTCPPTPVCKPVRRIPWSNESVPSGVWREICRRKKG